MNLQNLNSNVVSRVVARLNNCEYNSAIKQVQNDTGMNIIEAKEVVDYIQLQLDRTQIKLDQLTSHND